ncbi:MAG TPA: TIM barrel protein [Symbiobacteriaceae bacterium]|nr:TIM barrel protein [Symbiobacteriaceae bacterium]
MAQLFVPLGGGFQKAAGSGFNTYGENLDRPQWQGAEIGLCDTFPDVLGAVSEAEFHDWIIGVHHPLFIEKGPPWARFLHPDAAVRAEALDVAATSAVAAHHLGARYILFHYPWPCLQEPGRDYGKEGWYFTYPTSEFLEDWPEQKLYEVSRRVFERMAEVQAKESIKIVFEIDGPNPHFFDGELYTRLFEEFPELSLCVDTGRLGLLARTHGQDPLALARRWLPWTRHMHLHTSMWDEARQMRNHVPTDGTHTADRWPDVTPAADVARMIVAAQPRCTVVLEHNPRAVPPEQLERCHAWAAALVKGEG